MIQSTRLRSSFAAACTLAALSAALLVGGTAGCKRVSKKDQEGTGSAGGMDGWKAAVTTPM